MSTKVVSSRIPEEVYSKLEKKAVNEGKHIGILVREIIENHTKLNKTAENGYLQRILSYLNPLKAFKRHSKPSETIENDSKLQQTTLNDDELHQVTSEDTVVIPNENVYKKLEEIKNLIKELKEIQYLHFEGLEVNVHHIKEDVCSIVGKLGYN